jgi:hypothetical protein
VSSLAPSGRDIRRRVLVVGGVLAVILLLAAAWFGWLAWKVYSDLDDASDAAAALQQSLTAGDEQNSRSAFASLEKHSDSARDRTDGLSWSLLTHLPVVGDDAEGVEVASSVLADLSTDGLSPIIDSATDLQSLAPKDGTVPLDTIAALQDPVAQAHAAFQRADERLADEDTSGYTGRLRRQYRELAGRVDDANRALDAADKAVRLMPDMLGAQGVRRYLLVFQSNAEIRSTGGLPGSVALVEARDGKVTMRRQVAGHSFGEDAQPVLPLTEGEQQIYGRQLGTYFLDANFTPDFPRAAELMSAHWQRRFGQQVDGVFVVDPVALSYVLAVTGPIDLGLDEPLTAETAVQGLLNTVYSVFQDPAQQDAFFEQVAREVFTAFTQGRGAPADLLRAVSRGVEEHRILAHSFDPVEQKILAGSDIAGELVTDPDETAPQVGVFLNDNTGSKMSYYLRTDVSVDATFCKGGTQGLTGEAVLESVAPPDAGTVLPATITGGGLYGIEAGSQLVALRLYAPVGGTVSDIQFDRTPVDDVEVVDHDGRQVATTYVFLAPGQVVRVTWSMVTGPGQTGDIEVDVTPGIAPEDTSSVEPGSC